MPGGNRLSRKQALAVAALLTCKTLKEAAAKVGVGERTLRNWLELPAFRAASTRARRQILERTVSRLLGATDQAVETLERNLTCDEPGHEIRAAIGILDHAVKAVEVLELAEEIEALKQQVEELKSEHSNAVPPGDEAETDADAQERDGLAPIGPCAS